MTVQISIISPEMEAHRTGCADIKRLLGHTKRGMQSANSQHETVYSGDTALEAIIEADTDLADAFGQDLYEVDPGETPWTLAGCKIAPCMSAILRGLVQTGKQGQWTETTGPALPGGQRAVTAHTNYCLCGCGLKPAGARSKFRPGHDMRVRSPHKGRRIAGYRS